MELPNDHDPTFITLHTSHLNLKNLLKSSTNMNICYQKAQHKLEAIQENLSMASKTVAPLQSHSIATKALQTRINRAISPALALLESFKLFELLQQKLLRTASKLLTEKKDNKRLKNLIRYVDNIDKLKEAISCISEEREPAIQKLQEVVEFLSRTKATDYYRTERLRETMFTLKVVCETEVEGMRFDGVLDEGLLNLQDEFAVLLGKLKHRINGGDDDDEKENPLGSDLEVEVLGKISETLAANDCLDICIDIFVQVRYRRAAKALMRLNPDYLKTYTPEQIDDLEWETLETAISLWTQHFQLALKTVLISEKTLCKQVLGNILDGIIWPECFIKIADKIMAVFFRFGEGVTRSSKEPQKLFKLLDMFDLLEKLKTDFSNIFEGDSGADIRTRFRELEKLIVYSSTKVFWEFGLQIEENYQDGLLPPLDGSVPKLVRYAINYLKNLSMDEYRATMGKVLRTEQLWKSGIVLKVENDEDLLKEAVCNVVEAIQRNIEFKKTCYKDKVVAEIFSMNTYWYVYMRSRNTELGKLVGEGYVKKRFRKAAEESAYLYQKLAWGSLVRFIDKEEIMRRKSSGDREGIVGVVRGKMESFMVGFEEMCERHKSSYKIVSDADLREQMMEAAVKVLVPKYKEFFEAYSSAFESSPSPLVVEDMLRNIFEGGLNLLRRDSMSLH